MENKTTKIDKINEQNKQKNKNEIKQKIKLATVFSGIGAPEQALQKMNIPHEIVFACDNGERILDKTKEEILEEAQEKDIEVNEYVKTLYNNLKKKNYVKESYFANYDITEEKWYEDIRFLDGTKYQDQVDILVGGSPCQSFSIMGKRAGLEDARGTLFYDYARLIKEIQPKAFIYENVLGMLSHDSGRTWRYIKEIFESLDYQLNIHVLNSANYGIPQSRRRLFIVGFKNQNAKYKTPKEVELTTETKDYLETYIKAKYYLGEKGFDFVIRNENKRTRINRKIIGTQTACQQSHWIGDFIFEELEKVNKRKNKEEILNRAYIGSWNNKQGIIRQLTPRECLRLMGFDDSFKIVVSDNVAYRQAGNSIVVNVLEAIYKSVFEVFEELEKEDKEKKEILDE